MSYETIIIFEKSEGSVMDDGCEQIPIAPLGQQTYDTDIKSINQQAFSISFLSHLGHYFQLESILSTF